MYSKRSMLGVTICRVGIHILVNPGWGGFGGGREITKLAIGAQHWFSSVTN